MNTQTPTRMPGAAARGSMAPRSEEPDSVDLIEMLRGLWRRKGIVLGAALLAGGLVALALSQVTPRYTAVAKVMLDPRQHRVVTSEEVVSDLDLSNPVIETEVAVIRSSVLLESVVDAIGLERMAEFDPALAEPEPAWRERVDRAVARLDGLWRGPGPEPDAAAPAPAAREEADAVATPGRRVVGRMRPFLDVYQEGKSYVIAIEASAEDPGLAARLVNTIAGRYIESQLAERVEATRRATAWLETRVADLRQQLEDAENGVEVYRAEKLTADGGGLETVNQQLAAMSGQLAVARADHAGAQARHDQIRALVRAEGPPAAAEVLSSPLVTTLREDRSALLRQEADLATRYGEAHPLRVRLGAEIGRVEADLAEEVDDLIEVLEQEVEVARIRERAIAEELLALEERVSAISGSSIDLRALEREAEALRTVYESLLSRLKETRAQEALAQAEARVIERALPPGAPSYPRTKLLVAAASVAGAGLGLGLALLLELGASTVRSAHQLERELGLPVLASLPRTRGRRTAAQALRTLAARPYEDYGERIRQLRTALMFGGGRAARSVVVTSSSPGEGKTGTALAIAHMTALAGRSVIVVDCDFRRGAVSDAFGWNARADLVAVLQGNAAPDDAIVSDERLAFDVLPTARPAVADVSDMLSPARLRALLDWLGERYDLVLIDAPPVLHAADARVIAHSADALLYLVRWRAQMAAVRQGLALLSEIGVEPTGLVLTMVGAKSVREARRGGHVPRRMIEGGA